MTTSSPSTPNEAVAALERGNKVQAIAITRKTNGIELKEAKDEVEAYLAANPSIYEAFKQQQRKSGYGFAVFALLAAIALVVWLFFGGKL